MARELYRVRIPLQLESMRVRDVDREVKRVSIAVDLDATSHEDAIERVKLSVTDVISKALLSRDTLNAIQGMFSDAVMNKKDGGNG